MSTPTGAPRGSRSEVTPADAGTAELLREVTRVADRLRSLGLPRLDRPSGAGSPADRAHAAAQQLADLAAACADRPTRPVPRLGAHAGGDQLVVLAQDVLTEGDAQAVTAATEALVTLRRTL